MRLAPIVDTTPATVSRYLLPDERRVIFVHKHPAVLIGPIFAALAGLAAAGWLSESAAYRHGASILLIWILWGVLLLGLGLAVWAWAVGYFVVTSQRLLFIRGVITRKVKTIPLTEIKDMTLRQPATGRLLGYGTFTFKSAGRDQALHKVRLVPYPDQMYLELCALIFNDAASQDARADASEFAEEIPRDPRVHPRTRGEKEAGPRDRYLVGRVTEEVEVGREFFLSLQVKATRPEPLAGVSQSLLRVGRSGDLLAVLVADPLFSVLTDDKVIVPVPREGEGPEKGFTLRAQRAGTGLLRVDVYQGTQALDTFRFPVTVTMTRTESEAQARSIGVPETPAPAGLMRIVLTGPKERRNILLVVGEKYLGDHPLDIGERELKEQLQKITAQLNAFTDSTARGSITRKRGELHGLGKQIYSRLLPRSFVEEFRAYRPSAASLAIQGSSPLPWELMADSDDDRFLAEELRVTRWLHGSVPRAPIQLGNAIFACTEGMNGARQEIDEIRQLLSPSQESAIIAESVQLYNRMKAGDFDLFHFAGHTREDTSLETTALDFGNDDDYTLSYMANVPESALTRSRPVIFLNACGSASGLGRQTLFEEWAELFIDRGAGAFIGSLWNIRSDTANMFAIDLYRSLREGAASTLGEAVEFARHSSSGDPSDPTRLAYALYGKDDAEVILNPG